MSEDTYITVKLTDKLLHTNLLILKVKLNNKTLNATIEALFHFLIINNR